MGTRRGQPFTALIAACSIVALGGCAKFYWVKPASTPEQFSRDNAKCKAEASSSPAAAPDVEQLTYRRCLRALGYERQEFAFPPADAHRGLEEFD